MATKRLTALSVASIQPKDHRIEIPDGGARGLYLVVQPSGKKSFAVRYRHNGRPCKLTLGSGLSLAAARELAAKALHDLERGIDPGQTKKKEKADAEIAAGTTLRAICESYLRYEESKPADRRLRTVSQRRATVTRLVLPHKLAGRPIGEIRRGELIALLDDVETTRGPRMADEVLATLRRIFDWHALRDESFRTPLIKGMARTKPKERQRSRVLSDAELCKVWRVADGMGPFGSFVQFLLLTCTRRSEAAHARWSEMSNGDWTIPSARYKSKHDHAIPLSGAARALLAKQPRFAGCDYIFTSDGQRPVAYSHGKRRLDELSGVTNWRLHDARRSARTLLSRAAITSDISERCLGHAVGGIRAVYDRHSFRAEMAHAFEALAALIERIVNAPGGGNVVPLAGPFARPWPLVDPPPHRKPLPPTQTLQPSLFINENKFFSAAGAAGADQSADAERRGHQRRAQARAGRERQGTPAWRRADDPGVWHRLGDDPGACC